MRPSAFAVDPDVEPVATKADWVANSLRMELITGEYEAGVKLRIQDLASRFDVSQTTIREVLPKLTAEGLLESEAQRGYRVAALSLIDLNELIALRLDIELPAFREAVMHGGTEWEVGILRAQHMMRKYVQQQGDTGLAELTPGWIQVHGGFHAALLAGCPSSQRKMYCRHLFDQASRYFCLAARALPSSRDNLDDHITLGDLALERDVEGGVAHLRAHIEKAHTNARTVLFGGLDALI